MNDPSFLPLYILYFLCSICKMSHKRKSSFCDWCDQSKQLLQNILLKVNENADNEDQIEQRLQERLQRIEEKMGHVEPTALVNSPTSWGNLDEYQNQREQSLKKTYFNQCVITLQTKLNVPRYMNNNLLYHYSIVKAIKNTNIHQ